MASVYLIDLFTDTAGILNYLDLGKIMGCPGGMSTIRSLAQYLRAPFWANLSLSFLRKRLGKKIVVPRLDVIMIAFFSSYTTTLEISAIWLA